MMLIYKVGFSKQDQCYVAEVVLGFFLQFNTILLIITLVSTFPKLFRKLTS